MHLLPASGFVRQPGTGAVSKVSLQLVDLSMTGAQALSSDRLAVETPLVVQFIPPGDRLAIPLLARVVWIAQTGDGWRFGVEFSDLTDDVHKQLARCLFRMRNAGEQAWRAA